MENKDCENGSWDVWESGLPYQEKPWKAMGGMECYGRSWNMPWETMAIDGGPWNPMEGDGRSQNPMEPYGRIIVTQSWCGKPLAQPHVE